MIIVKVGGGEGIQYDHLCDDVAALLDQGQQLLLIHGGSHRTNQVARALGHPPQFITSPSGYSSRRTDRRTLEIFEMVYCGQVNKSIVESLQARGVNALGLSGLDGGLWRGPRKNALRAVLDDGRQRIVRDDYTGRVESVDVSLLDTLLQAGYLPVLTPPALSFQGEAINVDGDRAAAATAVAIKATDLVILSNVPGLLRRPEDETSLIARIAPEKVDEVATKYARGRMRIKVLAVREALAGGVPRIVLGDARLPQPISQALRGTGTVIQKEQVTA